MLPPEVVGGLIAGLIVGVLTGPVMAWYFDSDNVRPFAPIRLILGACMPSVVIIGFMSAYYSGWAGSGSGSRTARSLLFSILSVLVVGGLAIVTAEEFGVSEYLDRLMEGGKVSLLLGGLIYGVLVSTVLGLAIGLSMFLSRYWQPPGVDRQS